MTGEYVRQLFDYNPETGVLTWQTGRKLAGKVAGTVDRYGYLMVKVDGKKRIASRVIWLWMTGQWPAFTVDHQDRNRLNNRWSNLRDVTQAVNNQNLSLHWKNKSGVRGVCWVESRQKWQAQIGIGRKVKYLGYFGSFDAAVTARKQAESTLWDLPKGG